MNNIKNLMTQLQTELIKFEDSIGKTTQEQLSKENLNEKITEIKDVAFKLPENDSSENITQKYFFRAIKECVFDLNIKNLNSLTKDVQKIIGYIQLHYFPAHSYNEVDFECVWLCPTLLSLLRASNTRIIQLEFGPTAYKAILENDPVVYDWLLQLALAEILPANKNQSSLVLRELPQGSSRAIFQQLYNEGRALLKNESETLKDKTFSDLKLRYEHLEKSIIPQFEILCNSYSKQVEEIERSCDLSIGPTVSSLLIGNNVVKNDNILIQEVVKTIQSLAQILSCNNRRLFSSLMKLSSVTDYWSFHHQVFYPKFSYFIYSSCNLPFQEVYMLYRKFLSQIKFTCLNQEDYYNFHKTIWDHPQLEEASLEQILFVKNFEPFIEKKMMQLITAKGVFAYSGIESLPFSQYASLFISAIRCNCTEVCNDLMHLKQYQLFKPNERHFQSAVREALETTNITVFKFLMKHTAFAGIHSEFLKKCIELLPDEARCPGTEWRHILIRLESQLLWSKT